MRSLRLLRSLRIRSSSSSFAFSAASSLAVAHIFYLLYRIRIDVRFICRITAHRWWRPVHVCAHKKNVPSFVYISIAHGFVTSIHSFFFSSPSLDISKCVDYIDAQSIFFPATFEFEFFCFFFRRHKHVDFCLLQESRFHNNCCTSPSQRIYCRQAGWHPYTDTMDDINQI